MKPLVSKYDELFHFQSITLTKVLDNRKGIYQKDLSEFAQRWIEYNTPYSVQVDSSAPDAQSILVQPPFQKKLPGEVLLAIKAVRGPKGFSLYVTLYSLKEAQVLFHRKKEFINSDKLKDLEHELSDLLQNLFGDFPFLGSITSRRNNVFTINVGTRLGLKDGDKIPVVQIIGIQRHPVENFIVKSEREILGRLIIQQADEQLSIATLDYEAEPQALQPGMKVLRSAERMEVDTPAIASSTETGPGTEKGQKATPAVRNTEKGASGEVHFGLGLGNLSIYNNLETAGSLSARAISPSIYLNSQFTLVDAWKLGFDFQRYFSNFNNPASGSSPNPVPGYGQYMSIAGIYGVSAGSSSNEIGANFGVGLDSWKLSLNDQSPRALTTHNFSGLSLKLQGKISLNPTWKMLAGLSYLPKAQFSEEPFNSGSATAASGARFQTQFLYQNRYHIGILLSSYEAKLSGTGTRGDSASTVSSTDFSFLGGVSLQFGN